MAAESKSDNQGALDGFITLVQTNKGAACSMVIQQVLKSPVIYQFGEILTEPNVQELEKSPEHKPWLDLLKVFAYGTYSEYKANKDKLRLPALNPAQLTKLKLLTIVSFAAQHKVLEYSLLLRELDIAAVRELEDLLIDSVYLGLIKGKLDQKKAAFEVQFAMGRDIGPADVDGMKRKLQAWLSASTQLTEVLDRQIAMANEEKLREAQDEEALSKEKKDRIEAIKIQQKEAEQQGGGNSLMAQMAGGMMGLMGMGDDRGGRRRPQPRARGFGGAGGHRSHGGGWGRS